ncbi:hypothetical protein BKA70DRAFT_1423355 [Coprinopsis sp. MPI-PUGE-AT-0042]|nr:hypothetical protein BKA70DRAFT_1423355 [Coprinopsis sp. MPI-PUGE-AT-0042]
MSENGYTVPSQVWPDALNDATNFEVNAGGPVFSGAPQEDEEGVLFGRQDRTRIIEDPTFALHNRRLRDMDTEEVLAEAISRGRKVMALERKIERLQRDIHKQRAISKALLRTMEATYNSHVCKVEHTSAANPKPSSSRHEGCA